MAVLNPPIALQTRADHNADDLRNALGALWTPGGNLTPRQGIIQGSSGPGSDPLAVTGATPAAMTVAVQPGSVVLATPTAGHGGYIVTNDALLTLPIAAAHATLPRTDRVIVRVADPQYWAGGDGAAAIRVITGTPATIATLPDVPTTEGVFYDLARVNVAAGATSIAGTAVLYGQASSGRAYTPPAGGILAVLSTAQRDAISNPYTGMLCLTTTDSQVYLYLGASSGWYPLRLGFPSDERPTNYSTTVYSNGASAWASAGQTSVRMKLNNFVTAFGRLTLGDNGPTFGGSGNVSLTMPYNPGPALASGDPVGLWHYVNYNGDTVANGTLAFYGAWQKAICVANNTYAPIGTSYMYRLQWSFSYYNGA